MNVPQAVAGQVQVQNLLVMEFGFDCFEFFCMPAKTGVAELAQKEIQQLEVVHP